MTQHGFTTFVVVFSNDVSDVTRHKRRRNFAVHEFTVG